MFWEKIFKLQEQLQGTSNSSWGRGPSPSRQDANCTKAGVWPAMRCIAHGGGRRCDEPGCDKIALGYKGTASKCFGHGEG